MDLTPRATYVHELALILQAKGSNHTLPVHVTSRVAALIYPQPVKYVDLVIEGDKTEPGLIKGDVIVFTEQAIAEVHFEKVLDLDGVINDRLEDHRGAEVSVELRTRGTLVGISLPADLNDALVWQKVYESDFAFPARGQVKLWYQGRRGPILLPTSWRNADGLDELIASLPADLVK